MKDNKLIAEFMGMTFDHTHEHGNIYLAKVVKPYIEYCKSQRITPKTCEFHTSWDWLMPVIDKIYSSDEYIKYKRDTSGQFESEIHINTKSIQRTWEDVVEFIKWYNKQE
jgi:hypothetical protein